MEISHYGNLYKSKKKPQKNFSIIMMIEINFKLYFLQTLIFFNFYGNLYKKYIKNYMKIFQRY